MFHFLNPAVLLALSAGLIPLLIHLFNRRKYKEVKFSTIHFLKEMVRKEMRRLRLRQILLLIVRTLIILLLVLAFARPTLKSKAGFISGRASSEVVVVIDNSLSLNSLELTGNLLEHVRQWWYRLEEFFQTRDRISVILGTDPVKVLAEREYYSPDLWKKIVKDIQPTALQGNLEMASWAALDIFNRSETASRELYFISDFQQNGVSPASMKEISSQMPESAKMFFLPVNHTDDKNISIDSANIVNQLIEKNISLQIDAVLHNQNHNEYLNTMVSLILDGNRMAQNNSGMSPSESRVIRFHSDIQQNGHISGYVECESDALLEDNRFYFNFYTPENVKILHLTPGPGFESYLPTILKPALEKNIFSYNRISLADWPAENFFQYQAIILEGFETIPPELGNRLLQYSRKGNGIFMIPGVNMALSSVNDALQQLGLGQVISRVGTPGDNQKFVTVGKINWDHPLFEGLFQERKELKPIIFNAYYKIKPFLASETVIRLQNNDGLLLENGKEKGPVFLLVSPLQPEWTNLLIRGFVVPLVYRVLYYSVTKNTAPRIHLRAGEAYSQVFQNLIPPYEFTLRRPGGLEEKISPAFRGPDVVLQINKNDDLGNYQILQKDKLIAVYSVNHPASESLQEFYSGDDLRKAFPASTWINSDENLATEIEKSRFGRELWSYLLGLAIVFIFVEMFLGYTTSKKQKELSDAGQSGTN